MILSDKLNPKTLTKLKSLHTTMSKSRFPDNPVNDEVFNTPKDVDSLLTEEEHNSKDYIPYWKSEDGHHNINRMGGEMTAKSLNHCMKKLSDTLEDYNEVRKKVLFWLNKGCELQNRLNQLDHPYGSVDYNIVRLLKSMEVEGITQNLVDLE